MMITFRSVTHLLLLAVCLPILAHADRIELADGSVVVGRIVSITGGKLKVETRFAGTITIKQEEVSRLDSDDALHVNLADGATRLARLAGPEAGAWVEGEEAGPVTAPAEITEAWRQGAESPTARIAREMAEKARRKWSYEASVAVSGRTGSREKFNGTAGFKATLASAHDRLILSVSGERARDKGASTADRDFGGVDYSSFFSKDYGWYVRSSLERDQIRSIDLRSTTAAGFSRKLVRKGPLDLQFRSGASYIYENYVSGQGLGSPGLDVAFLSIYTFPGAKLNSTLTYTPVFKEFSNYRLRHESSLEVPLTASLWKLKVAMTNEYLSRPQKRDEGLETTYTSSLILSWR